MHTRGRHYFRQCRGHHLCEFGGFIGVEMLDELHTSLHKSINVVRYLRFGHVGHPCVHNNELVVFPLNVPLQNTVRENNFARSEKRGK